MILSKVYYNMNKKISTKMEINIQQFFIEHCDNNLVNIKHESFNINQHSLMRQTFIVETNTFFLLNTVTITY